MNTSKGWQVGITCDQTPVTDKARAELALAAVTRQHRLEVESDDPHLGSWLAELPNSMALQAVQAGWATWSAGPFTVELEVPDGDYGFLLG
jgi:hypothetical protein